MNYQKQPGMHMGMKPGHPPGANTTSYANQDMKARALTTAISRLKTRLKRPKGAAVPPAGKGSGHQNFRAATPSKAQPSPGGQKQLWQTRAVGTTSKRPTGNTDKEVAPAAEARQMGRGGIRG